MKTPALNFGLDFSFTTAQHAAFVNALEARIKLLEAKGENNVVLNSTCAAMKDAWLLELLKGKTFSKEKEDEAAKGSLFVEHPAEGVTKVSAEFNLKFGEEMYIDVLTKTLENYEIIDTVLGKIFGMIKDDSVRVKVTKEKLAELGIELI